jgi:hypothetical protein
VFTQAPLVHASAVQGLLSLHSVLVVQPPPQPSIGACTQPEPALHESAVHASPSSQLGAAPAWHIPD